MCREEAVLQKMSWWRFDPDSPSARGFEPLRLVWGSPGHSMLPRQTAERTTAVGACWILFSRRRSNNWWSAHAGTALPNMAFAVQRTLTRPSKISSASQVINCPTPAAHRPSKPFPESGEIHCSSVSIGSFSEQDPRCNVAKPSFD